MTRSDSTICPKCGRAHCANIELNNGVSCALAVYRASQARRVEVHFDNWRGIGSIAVSTDDAQYTPWTGDNCKLAGCS